MRYYVIAPDGSKFGPADLNTLKTWAAQGRIAPNTILEEEQSRQRVEARLVAGLFGAEVPSFTQASAGRGGGRPEFGRRGDDGSSDILISYICSAMTLICCCVFNIGGWVYANRALAKGNPKGNGARVFAIIMLVLWIITTIITIPFMGQLYKMLHDAAGMNAGG